MSTLTENLRAVRYPVEDKQEIAVILAKLELQAEMISRETVEADAAISRAETALAESRASQAALLATLDAQHQHQRNLESIHEFIESFKTPKPVMIEGREVIADLHHTRQQESELISQLESEYEALLAEEAALGESWQNRFSAFLEVKKGVEAWAEKFEMGKPWGEKGREERKQGPEEEHEYKPEPEPEQQPEHENEHEHENEDEHNSPPQSDIEMEIE